MARFKPIKSTRAFLRMLGIALSLSSFVIFYLIKIRFVKHTPEAGYRLRRSWVALAIKILGIKIQKEGDIPDQHCLYVINHRNLIDPAIIAHFIDVVYISKAEVEKYPFLGRGAALTGVIYVKREEKNSRRAARQALHDALKFGMSVGIFPEGTTGTSETTKEFFIGSFEEAAKLKVPVVPIAIEYKKRSDLWIQNSTLKQFLIQFGKRRTQAKVKIHEPILSEDPHYLLNESQRLINNTLKDMHKGWSDVWK